MPHRKIVKIRLSSIALVEGSLNVVANLRWISLCLDDLSGNGGVQRAAGSCF